MGQACKVQVLIIENEETSRAIDQLKMQSSACEIKVVRSRQEAESELQSKKYDLVLVDWKSTKSEQGV